MVNFMYKLSREYSYKAKSIKSKSQGYLFHVVYYSAIKLIENVRYHIASDEKVSTTLSNFLHSIGIKSIIDKGSSTMHDNEPSQVVVINQGPDSNYELIGTYTNYTTELDRVNYSRYISEFSGERLEVLAKIIQDSTNNITKTSVEDPDLAPIDKDGVYDDDDDEEIVFDVDKMNAETESYLKKKNMSKGITESYIRHVLDDLRLK